VNLPNTTTRAVVFNEAEGEPLKLTLFQRLLFVARVRRNGPLYGKVRQ
jgi:hypothetical protein